MNKSNTKLSLTELANQTGVSKSTLNKWLDRGFIHAVEKNKNNRPRFEQDCVDRVRTLRTVVDMTQSKDARKAFIEKLDSLFTTALD